MAGMVDPFGPRGRWLLLEQRILQEVHEVCMAMDGQRGIYYPGHAQLWIDYEEVHGDGSR